MAELDGRGEVVGGIVVMRFGENALRVIDRVKARLRDVATAAAGGVEIVPTYDRSGLIRESIATLRETLIEEAIVVSLVVMAFLFHFRSALVPILALPIAVVAAFIPMYYLGVTSNIMSLGGIALAIGVLVDASIVMVENAYRRVSASRARSGRPGRLRGPAARGRRRREAGGPRDLLFARDHHRVVRARVPARGAGRPDVPAARLHEDVRDGVGDAALDHARPGADDALPARASAAARSVEPVLRASHRGLRADPALALRWKWAALAGQRGGRPADDSAASSCIGSEFMPPLYEGSLLYMPTAPPGLSITEATRLLQVQDKLLREFPEVERVFGTVGRGTTATDNSPMGMVNTTVTLKPREQWRPGMTLEALQAEMDAALQFPGFPNVWTQPIRNRLDMLSTGIKTPVGIKIFGPDLSVIERLGEQIERVLERVDGTRSVYAERVTQGYFTDIRIDRAAIARYGLTDRGRAGRDPVGARRREHHAHDRRPRALSGQRALRARLPRRAFRTLERVLVKTPAARRSRSASSRRSTLTTGPAMIRDENAQLAGYVYIDTATRDIGGYVDRAREAIAPASCRCRPATRCSGPGSTSSRCARASGCRS